MTDLPTGWTRASGADVFEFVTSGSRGWAQYYAEAGDVFIRMGNLDHGTITLDLRDVQRVQPPKGAEGERTRVRANDILISITAEVGMVGLVRPTLEKAYINQHVALARPRSGNDPRYLARFLTSEADGKRQLLGMKRGATKVGLALDDIRRVEFRLPPLAEQKRIADKLDLLLARVDACRERLDRVPQIVDRLRKSVLAAAYTGALTEGFRNSAPLTPISRTLRDITVPPRPHRYAPRTDAPMDGDYALSVGDPGRELPDGWQWVPLVNVARMESGHTPSRGHPEYWGGAVPWIGIADAREGHGQTIVSTQQQTNALGLANSAARLLPAGTICLSRTASVGYVVRMGVPMATSQDFANWTCTEAVNPDWLKFLLVAETEAILRFGKGSTHTTVYYPELTAFHVALPPVEEQAEIVRRVTTLLGLADNIRERFDAARSELDSLTPALLAKAFRGDLAESDKFDECVIGESDGVEISA